MNHGEPRAAWRLAGVGVAALSCCTGACVDGQGGTPESLQLTAAEPGPGASSSPGLDLLPLRNRSVRLGEQLVVPLDVVTGDPTVPVQLSVLVNEAAGPEGVLWIDADQALHWHASPSEPARLDITVRAATADAWVERPLVLRSFRHAVLPAGQIAPFAARHHALGHAGEGGFDWIPDLAAIATIVVDDQLALDAGGSPSEVAWSHIVQLVELAPHDVVLIEHGVRVLYDEQMHEDDAPYYAIAVRGELAFAGDRATRLRVGTILVDGGPGRPAAGRLAIDTPDPRITTEIVFDGVVDTLRDPGQVALGLVATGGEVELHGAGIRGHRGRVLSATRGAGHTDLVIDGPFGFSPLAGGESAGPSFPAQHVYLADAARRLWDTQRSAACPSGFGQACPFPQQGELVRIRDIQPDGEHTLVRVEGALAHDHTGGHAGFVTRNVVLRSARPDEIARRGHVMLLGPTEVLIDGVAFENLGRTTTAILNDTRFDALGAPLHVGTNQRGRYALHLHQLASKFEVQSASVFIDPSDVLDHDIKWAIAQHGSYGEVVDTVCAGEVGACFAGEDGSETGEWRGNLAIGTGGGSLVSNTHVRVHLLDEAGQRLEDHGHAGYGYWMRGPMIAVGGPQPEDGNVAAGVWAVAFSYDLAVSGAHATLATHGAELARSDGDPYYDEVLARASAGAIPVRAIRNHRFRHNVAVGTMLRGALLERWYATVPYRVEDCELRLLGRSRIAAARHAIMAFYGGIEVARSYLYGTSLPDDPPPSAGVGINDTSSAEIHVTDTIIAGFSIGVRMGPSGGRIVRSVLRNETNVLVGTLADRFPFTPDDGTPRTREVVIQDVVFMHLYDHERQRNVRVAMPDGQYTSFMFSRNVQPTIVAIHGSVDADCDGAGCESVLDHLYVYDAKQDPSYVPFDGSWGLGHLRDPMSGATVSLAGLTNDELHARFGVSRGGLLMPCAPTGNPGQESCTYSGGIVEHGARYGIAGFVATTPPAGDLVIPAVYDLVWRSRYALSYRRCSAGIAGTWTCGAAVPVPRQAVTLCRYASDGSASCAPALPPPGISPQSESFELPDIGVYSITMLVPVNGVNRPVTFFIGRQA